ncbi:MAG: hypothetical protein HQK58_06805 [Deltaproteobacteria bacterium]|nr:hypothetical protein [Deltaproteobacteria bacterium]
MKKQSAKQTVTASETARLLLNPQEASIYLNGLYSQSYLAQLRLRTPDNPKFRRINGRVYYHQQDLDRLLEGQSTDRPEVEGKADDKR